jgi:hypothetical protein
MKKLIALVLLIVVCIMMLSTTVLADKYACCDYYNSWAVSYGNVYYGECSWWQRHTDGMCIAAGELMDEYIARYDHCVDIINQGYVCTAND